MKDNLELLRIAGVIANLMHQELRTDLHNQWLQDTSKQWRDNGTMVPYPQMPMFPDEQEIVDLARDLKKFLLSRKTAIQEQRPIKPEFPMEPEEQPKIEEPVEDAPTEPTENKEESV